MGRRGRAHHHKAKTQQTLPEVVDSATHKANQTGYRSEQHEGICAETQELSKSKRQERADGAACVVGRVVVWELIRARPIPASNVSNAGQRKRDNASHAVGGSIDRGDCCCDLPRIENPFRKRRRPIRAHRTRPVRTAAIFTVSAFQ